MADVLEDYVAASLVELIYFSESWRADEKLFKDMYATSTRGFLSPQGWAYDNCFRMFGHRHTFLLLLDPDEYIVIKEGPKQQPALSISSNATASAATGLSAAASAAAAAGAAPSRPHLPSFLAPFEAYGGLAVHWQLFGPSGHVARPHGSTLASYTECMPKHVMQRWQQFRSIPLGFVKTFTATRCYKRGCNPHVCELKPGCKYVNEKFMDLTSSVVHAVHWDRIAVYHYVTRSVQDYQAKMARGSGHSQFLSANRAAGRTHRGWRYFRTVNASSIDTCTAGAEAWAACCDRRHSDTGGGGMGGADADGGGGGAVARASSGGSGGGGDVRHGGAAGGRGGG